jgi:U32 family peptidase
MNRPELLAPAGNLKKLKFALNYGADAVYCGVPAFSLRVRINQFDMRSLKQGIEYAHSLKKKVYVTVNIFAHQKHLKKLEAYILKLKQLKPDALIVSDSGVMVVIKKVWPKAEIHLSTQANCTNSEAVKFWVKQGVKRIILGREVTLKEIKEIHSAAPKVELECFVHGAMCMSYSGRCLLSKFFTDRSANLGDCTQPCRWEYKVKCKNTKMQKGETTNRESQLFLEEIKRPDDLLQIEEDEHGSYIMNSKDLCLIEYLDKLEDAGVCSFKIEGRAKSVYYLGSVVNAYRQAIDSKLPPTLKLRRAGKTQNSKLSLKNELEKTQNRGFTSGFVFGKEKCEQLDDKSHEVVDWEFCGEVLATNNLPSLTSSGKAGELATNTTNRLKKEYLITIKVHNQIFIGDKLEFVVKGEESFPYKVKKMYNEDMEELKEAHGGQDVDVYLEVKRELPEMTLVRRKIK